MATSTKCDSCESTAVPGQQWLRVRIEPFYPQRGLTSYPGDLAVAEGYAEGLFAEVCSPQCAATAFVEKSRQCAAGYDGLARAFQDAKLDAIQ